MKRRRPAPPHPLRSLIEMWRREAHAAWASRRDRGLGRSFEDGKRCERHRLCADHALGLEQVLDELEA